jgi:hypothetical protein
MFFSFLFFILNLLSYSKNIKLYLMVGEFHNWSSGACFRELKLKKCDIYGKKKLKFSSFVNRKVRFSDNNFKFGCSKRQIF